METRIALSIEDVTRLLANPSNDVRASIAEKVCAQFGRSDLSDGEREIALSIVAALADDVAVKVRQVLADSLKRSPDLSHEVAFKLACDLAEIAVPVLECSAVLTDDDLIRIVRRGGAAQQAAIAGRAQLGAELSAVLVTAGPEPVVARLVANPGAELGEVTLARAIQRFGDVPAVMEPMALRPSLPPGIVERLVTRVSERFAEHLLASQDMPAALASDLVLQSRERALMTLVTGDASPTDLAQLVAQLHEGGRLTPTLVLRALCLGDMAFFETAIAALAGVSPANARVLIHDAGPLGLKTLYERAGLPPGAFAAMRMALQVVGETEPGDRSLAQHRGRIIERILTQMQRLPEEDMDYLLGKLAELRPPARLKAAG